jgi:hypothetical protein
MKLVQLLCILPTASAFGKVKEKLYLHEGAGWCMSDLDETPCSFDCDASASNYMDDYEIATMCYEACVKDFPDEMIENVEYYPGGCYCQTSCPSMMCGSNTATLSPDYDLPDCTYSYQYDDDEDDYTCASTCFDEGEDFNVEMLCENYSTCATTCDDDDFASYDEIADYCVNGPEDDDECECDRRRLDAPPTPNARKPNARQAKNNFERTMKKIRISSQK